MADHEIGAILTLRDNMSATLRGVRGEQAGFRRDTTATQRVVREPMEFRVNAVAASKAIMGIGLAAGAAVLAAGGLAVAFGDDLQKSLNGVQASTGVANEAMGAVKATMVEIYNDNFGENFAEIGAAMATVTQQTGLTGDALKKVTEDSLTLKDTFGLEVTDSVKGANQLMKQFGVDGTTAYNLIAQGARSGLNASGDLLETLNEYGGTFAAQGFNAEEMFNMLSNASDSGIKDLDLAGDAIKELGIRSKDGSKTSAAGFEALGLNAASMTKAFAAGGDEAKAAFDKTTTALMAMDDPVAQNAAGTALMGTQWEDLGVKGVAALVNTKGAINASTDALKEINAVKYNTFGEAMEGIKRKLLTGILLPIDERITPSLNAFAGWIDTKMPAIKNEISYAMDVASGVFNAVSDVINTNVMPVVNLLSNLISENMPKIKSAIQSMYDYVRPSFERLGQAVSTDLIPTIQGLWGLIEQAMPTIRVVVELAMGVVATVFKTGIDMISTFIHVVKNIYDFIEPPLKLVIDIFNGVANAIQWAIDKINIFNKTPAEDKIITTNYKNVSEATSLAGRHGDNMSSDGSYNFIGLSQKLPGNNAAGTDNWRGGPTWVGEEGPEILNLPRGSRITPNHKALNQTQDIRQAVIPFEIMQATDLIQNVKQPRQNVIPFDGYIEKLSTGNRTQTVNENSYKGGGSSLSKGNVINNYFTLNGTVREEADIKRIADEFVRELNHAAVNM